MQDSFHLNLVVQKTCWSDIIIKGLCWGIATLSQTSEVSHPCNLSIVQCSVLPIQVLVWCHDGTSRWLRGEYECTCTSLML